MKALLDEIASPRRAPQFGRTSPLAGLRRRTLAPVDALAGSIAAAAPTAAGLTQPALLVQTSGDRAWLAVLLAAGLAMVMSLLVGVYARRLTGSGSLYTFVAQSVDTARAPGRLMSLATAACLVAAYGLVAVTSLAGAGYYFERLAALVGVMVPPPAAVLVAVGVGLVCLRLLLGRIAVSARVLLGVEGCALVVLLVPVVGALLAGWGAEPAGAPVVTAPASGTSGALHGLAAAVMVAMAAFIGFDHASFVGAETRRPLRTIPRVLNASVAIVAVVQVLTVTAALRSGSGWPLSGSAWWSPVLAVAGMLGFTACALACFTALSRLVLVLARDGIVPAGLGRTTRQGSPLGAVLVTIVPVVVVAVAAIVAAGDPWPVVSVCLVGGASAYVLAYLITAVAVPLFLRRIGELTVVPVILAAGAGTGLAAVWLGLLVDPVQVSDAWGARIGIVVPAVLGLVGWEIVRRRPTGRWGSYDVPTAADVLGGDEHPGGPDD